MKPLNRCFATFLLLAFFALGGCQEEYLADLEKIEPLLVVEGLITDRPGPYRISLSLSDRFQEPPVHRGVSGAVVTISVNDGKNIRLYESFYGNYFTPDDFIGETGKLYTLKITTSDGSQFASTPQEILPPIKIDSVFGVFSEKVFYMPSSVSNSLYSFKVGGTYAFISTSGSGEYATRFRYSSSLYVQYGVPINDVTVDNCWIKRPITNFQPRDLGFYSNIDGSSEEIGFAPIMAHGLSFLGYPPKLLYDQVRVMVHKFYTLNPESYSFHKAKNDQLNTDGRIFDPISAQLPGNVFCLSDPEKPVLGFFEASSETHLTYRIETQISKGTVNIIHLPAMVTIPNEGCVRNQLPSFWVN
jgi:hypothetical protein